MLPRDNLYRPQVVLLMDVLPLVAEERCFVLKGGTAINLFVRDLPRLSVDIDLTYVPVQDRTTSLAEVGKALERMALSLEGQSKNIRVDRRRAEGEIVKLLAWRGPVRVKIEVSPVLRGCVREPVMRSVSPPGGGRVRLYRGAGVAPTRSLCRQTLCGTGSTASARSIRCADLAGA